MGRWTRWRPIGVAATIAVALCGCGGSGSTATVQATAPAAAKAAPTAVEYAERVNAICRRWHARRTRVAGGTITSVALEASADLPELRAVNREEANVPVPPSEGSLVKALLAAEAMKYALESKIPAVAASEGTAGLLKLEPSLERNAGEVVALDHQLGLTTCAQ